MSSTQQKEEIVDDIDRRMLAQWLRVPAREIANRANISMQELDRRRRSLRLPRMVYTPRGNAGAPIPAGQDAISQAIAFARSEAEKFKMSVAGVFACWAAGFAVASIVEFASKKGVALAK